MITKLLRLTVYISAFILVFCSIAPVSANAQSASGELVWSKLASMEANDLNDVVVNDAHTYVAVGDGGTILRSNDGRQWQSVDASTTDNIKAVTTNGTKFVAVGDQGTILSSDDGSRWSSGTLDISLTVGDFSSAEDQQIINKSTIVAWDRTIQPAVTRISSVIWDGQKFVAVGDWHERFPSKFSSSELSDFTGFLVFVSEDGVNWNARKVNYDRQHVYKMTGVMYPDQFSKLIYTGSMYVATTRSSNTGSSAIFTSPDLDTWTLSVPNNKISINDAIYSNGQIIAVGYYLSASWTPKGKSNLNVVYSSQDGSEWTESEIESARGFSLSSIVWDGEQYVFASTLNRMVKSKDLTTWQTISSEVADRNKNWQSFINNPRTAKLIYDGKQYIAVGAYGSILVKGKINDYWDVAREKPYANFTNVVVDGSSRYVASSSVRDTSMGPFAAGIGSLWESADGYEWQTVQLEGNKTPYWLWPSIAAGNGTVLAYGIGNGLDGKEYLGYALSQKPGQWEFKKFPFDMGRNIDLFWFNGEFYAMGNDTYATSKDGVTWSALGTFVPPMRNMVTNGDIRIGLKQMDSHGSFENQLYSSYDGASWEQLDMHFSDSDHSNVANDLNWNGTQFAAISQKVTAVSTDGENWTYGHVDNRLKKLAGNSEQYVAIGFDYADRLFSSSDGLQYSPLAKLTDKRLDAIVWDGEKFIAVGYRGTILIGKPASLIRVMVDGQKLKLEKMPVVIDGTTMLPVRDIFNAVGANVTWDDTTKTATGTKDGHTIKLTLNSVNAFVDGKSVALSVSAQIVDNKLMVPSRFVAEAFGYEVQWDNATRTVHIATKKETNTHSKESESTKDSSHAKEQTKESSKPNESASSSGLAIQPSDSLDYTMEQATGPANRIYFNVKDKNNRTVLRYYQPDSSRNGADLHHTLMIDYTGEKDDYKFNFAQAVIEKEKGTTLSGLSDELTKAAHSNKQLNGMSPTIPLSINGTNVKYSIIHSEGSPLYSIEIDF
ncbi:stalk domain-containing protein [Paenibacillus sp. N3.4]|uniref:stalk domain-containing protein n=1 Tax=Paenibacillus sp. N3.4 TaxID=2603222 RepID=UPI0011C70895|nr:stalk domain-containing protein [Paenibacillus sp. N3.4]TXK77841.1 copper amine oxidase N-terminal domain-containing protein [Paenibacillus sp. N3.4]